MSSTELDRRVVVNQLLSARNGALVVTGLGSASYDVHSFEDRDDNYYLWGAMGAAGLVGLGVAQARPEERVMVITGDGEQLMALGGIATIAVAGPKNLDIVVLDNEHFGETGMQFSHTGQGIDLSSIASTCGFSAAGLVRTQGEVDSLCEALATSSDGPRLFVVKIMAENKPRSLPSRDAVHIKNRFRAHLGLDPN